MRLPYVLIDRRDPLGWGRPNTATSVGVALVTRCRPDCTRVRLLLSLKVRLSTCKMTIAQVLSYYTREVDRSRRD